MIVSGMKLQNITPKGLLVIMLLLFPAKGIAVSSSELLKVIDVDDPTVDAYFSGLAAMASGMNVMAKDELGSYIYCSPPHLIISRDIIKQSLRLGFEKYGDINAADLSIILGLQELFPCE